MSSLKKYIVFTCYWSLSLKRKVWSDTF